MDEELKLVLPLHRVGEHLLALAEILGESTETTAARAVDAAYDERESAKAG